MQCESPSGLRFTLSFAGRHTVNWIISPLRVEKYVRDICGMLDLDFNQMNKLAVADRIKRRYGTIPTEMAGKNPRFTQLERLLPGLTDEQFNLLLNSAEGFDRANRRQR